MAAHVHPEPCVTLYLEIVRVALKDLSYPMPKKRGPKQTANQKRNFLLSQREAKRIRRYARIYMGDGIRFDLEKIGIEYCWFLKLIQKHGVQV